MEVFVSQRDPEKAVSLTESLKALGLRGRDAAYLASAAVPGAGDRNALDHYLTEFRYMVSPERRPAAAELIGLGEY
ncbi:MAG: hypothetical protein JWO25_2312 [Alphaproteobacteria bacterium]|nr:hypothetical protein [Alphaproteobacteria bacterium]